MSDLRKMHKAARAREKANEAAEKACTRYGVFVYEPVNRYYAENAVDGKLYKSVKLADKAAARDVGHIKNHVVRHVDICTTADRDTLRNKLLYGECLNGR